MKEQQIIESVAKRLENLALELGNDELQTLANELGTVDMPDVAPDSCERCAQGEKFKRIIESMILYAYREGLDLDSIYARTRLHQEALYSAYARFNQPLTPVDFAKYLST
jgi:hypothetical protein